MAAAVKHEDSESAGSWMGSIPTSPLLTMFPFVPLLSQEISKSAFSQAGLALEKPAFSSLNVSSHCQACVLGYDGGIRYQSLLA